VVQLWLPLMMLVASPLAVPFARLSHVDPGDLPDCWLIVCVPLEILIWIVAVRVLFQLAARLAVHKRRLLADDVQAET